MQDASVLPRFLAHVRRLRQLRRVHGPLETHDVVRLGAVHLGLRSYDHALLNVEQVR